MFTNDYEKGQLFNFNFSSLISFPEILGIMALRKYRPKSKEEMCSTFQVCISYHRY